MTITNRSLIEGLINQNPNIMRRRDSRQKFARSLADILSFWNYAEMESFVEEMRGLNLSNREEQEIFLQFAEAWCRGVAA